MFQFSFNIGTNFPDNQYFAMCSYIIDMIISTSRIFRDEIITDRAWKL